MKFTPGYWKCRDGSKAEVFKEADERLWGRHFERNGLCVPRTWMPTGNSTGQDMMVYDSDLVSPWKDEPETVTAWANIYAERIFCCESEREADEYACKSRIACRRITYTPGKVLSEREALKEASITYAACDDFSHGIRMETACKAYLAAWKQGRVWDSTPEDA